MELKSFVHGIWLHAQNLKMCNYCVVWYLQCWLILLIVGSCSLLPCTPLYLVINNTLEFQLSAPCILSLSKYIDFRRQRYFLCGPSTYNRLSKVQFQNKARFSFVWNTKHSCTIHVHCKDNLVYWFLSRLPKEMSLPTHNKLFSFNKIYFVLLVSHLTCISVAASDVNISFPRKCWTGLMTTFMF